MIRLFLLMATLVLASCKKEPPPAPTTGGPEVVQLSTPELAPTAEPQETAEVESTEPAEESVPESNDDASLSTIENDRLYSSYDRYHRVRCWYMRSGHSGSWALSCLPSGQVENPEN